MEGSLRTSNLKQNLLQAHLLGAPRFFNSSSKKALGSHFKTKILCSLSYD